MSGRYFIDSNILIYAVAKNSPKCALSRKLLLDIVKKAVVSSQIINEFINVCIKKKIMPLTYTFKYAEEFMEIFNFALIGKKDIKLAMSIKEKYGYSYWDSLVVASALNNSCSILYTEDLQDGQIIENKLKIVNPFLAGR